MNATYPRTSPAIHSGEGCTVYRHGRYGQSLMLTDELRTELDPNGLGVIVAFGVTFTEQ